MRHYQRLGGHFIMAATAVATLLAVGTTSTLAGGTGESVLLIVNPSNPDSMYVANYYRAVRNIPAENVLYIDPGAANYASFVDVNLPALFGRLVNRDLSHIDQIVIAPDDQFFISASGLVEDGCVSVNRFSIGSAYTMAFISDEILGGTLRSSRRNQYYATDDSAYAFDSSLGWDHGLSDDDPAADRYFIGSMLGYTGERGNTVGEIIDLINRSAAVDGTHPDGTFYYMETTDDLRSGPRDGFFDRAVSSIQALGGQAEHLCCSPIPGAKHDVLGIMTGAASPNIDGGDFTLLPGAFCDHLTSYAGRFDTDSQVKMSRWISKGASGTAGTVEEPCNYPGKFPHARMHVFYFQGLTLGEATFRSLNFTPFQVLIYGDPMTRPWGYLPEVMVNDFPVGPVSGNVTITPEATTNHPRADIERFDLYIDGQMHASTAPGNVFNIESTRLDDGYHTVRVVASDSSIVETPGEWGGGLVVDNLGVSTSLTVVNNTGDLSTPFEFTIDAVGGSAIEFRLIHNGRVVATAADAGSPVTVYGADLGAGPVDVQAEVWHADGSRVMSEPIALDIAMDYGAPSQVVPITFDFSRYALSGESFVLELPAAFDDANADLTYTVIDAPTQATILGGSGAYRVLQANEGASGTDQLTFQVSSSGGDSEIATVTIIYEACHLGDMHLEIGPLNGGETGVFDITCAAPDELTFLAYSLRGEGETYVPQLNVTLGLQNPKQAGNAVRSDANGWSHWELPIPDLGQPRLIWLQAAQRGLASNVVLTQIN